MNKLNSYNLYTGLALYAGAISAMRSITHVILITDVRAQRPEDIALQ